MLTRQPPASFAIHVFLLRSLGCPAFLRRIYNLSAIAPRQFNDGKTHVLL